MDKTEILNKYPKPEDRILVAQILDKIEMVRTRNKPQNTDFLDLYQKTLVNKLFNQLEYQNYRFFGGVQEAEREIAFFIPDKYNEAMIEKLLNSVIKVIRITLPNTIPTTYTHREYLGGLMKLGIERKKIGDILVTKEGADILVSDDIYEFLRMQLPQLKRFMEAEIESISINELEVPIVQKEEIKIIVASLRLDSIVSELVRTSRSKATEYLRAERVFVNGINEIKPAKTMKEGDKITIRGKGRFEIRQIEGNTKKGRVIVKVLKFVS